jgi:hypothetical protein
VAAWLLPAAAEPVALMLSERGDAYQEVAAAMRGQLHPGAEVVEVTSGASEGLPRARIIAAVGARACEGAAVGGGRTPVLCVLCCLAARSKGRHAPPARAV